MRIIRGTCKSRIIHAPKSFKVRPTTDFAKEGMFNTLENNYDFEDLKVLDLFAGIGSISYEFASRGAFVTSVDINHKHIAFIAKMAAGLQLEHIKTTRDNAFDFLQDEQLDYDIIFADPPYDLENIEQLPALVTANSSFKNDSLFIIEHSRKYDFSESPCFYKLKRYGKVHFSFFMAK